MLSKASKKLALPGVCCISNSTRYPVHGISRYFIISFLLRHLEKHGGVSQETDESTFGYQKLKDLRIL